MPMGSYQAQLLCTTPTAPELHQTLPSSPTSWHRGHCWDTFHCFWIQRSCCSPITSQQVQQGSFQEEGVRQSRIRTWGNASQICQNGLHPIWRCWWVWFYGSKSNIKRGCKWRVGGVQGFDEWIRSGKWWAGGMLDEGEIKYYWCQRGQVGPMDTPTGDMTTNPWTQLGVNIFSFVVILRVPIIVIPTHKPSATAWTLWNPPPSWSILWHIMQR